MDISIIFDETFRLLKYPYDDMKEWSVFKAGANFGTFKFTVLSITGKYVGQENLQLPGFENSITAEKFTYKIIINIPDISNPFVSKNQ